MKILDMTFSESLLVCSQEHIGVISSHQAISLLAAGLQCSREEAAEFLGRVGEAKAPEEADEGPSGGDKP